MHLRVIAIFAKCAKCDIGENKEILLKLADLYLEKS